VKTGAVLLLILQTLCSSNFALAQQDAAERVVLVSMAPIQQLAADLLDNTPLELRLLPDSPRSMQAQATLFTRQADRYAADFAAADSVISIGQVWKTDPLYIATREVNIRVVNIDASKPYSHELDGVAVATSPATGELSPWFWLSPSNVIRTLDIMGADLQRLYPDAATTIAGNLEKSKSRYLQMKADFELKLLEAEDPAVYALADEFVYLTSDLGIFVDDYFVKQDIDWTAEDYSRLTQSLQNSGISVVLHKWEPAEPIKAAIAAAGARLVVLDTLETTTDFAAGLQQNLQALLAAFSPAQ
jgi:ABC-type Zn uptake system ZnuABC Zn-binding protein ZnuA